MHSDDMRANLHWLRRRHASRRYRGDRRILARRMPPQLLHGLQRRRSNSWGNLSKIILATLAVGGALWLGSIGVAAASAYAAWAYINRDLPTVQQAELLQFATTKIYDRNWRLLIELANPNTGFRTPVGYQEILDHITQQQSDSNAPHQAWIFDATVAAEDQTFWTNPGVDPTAIARAFLFNLQGAPISGASTITQQLVRMLFPQQIGDERSYTRKAREAIVAYQFTKYYTKQQILEMYLNDVYYGNRSYGIDAAAQTYFGEHPWNLTLGEAALLAGLPQAPSLYDPYQNYDLAKARQSYVLDQMVKQGMITPQQADDAKAEPLNLVPQGVANDTLLAPHFVNFVESYLEQKFGAAAVYGGGLTVRTTLDYNLQQQAQQIVTDQVKRLAYGRINNGSAVMMLPWSGEIVAMVGSADYYSSLIDGQVNVTLQPRSPGSSLKPVTYLAAFERGFYPGTILNDIAKQWPLPGQPGKYYRPRNYTGKNYGPVSVRTAIGNSLNIPAIETLDWVGVQNMIDLAHKMGIRSTLWGQYGLAVTVGGGDVTTLEETNVYATLANEGRYVPYNPLLEVTDSHGNTLYKLDRASVFNNGQQVAPAANVYQVTSILTDNNARAMIFGLRTALAVPELNRPVAAKSGTSEDSRDGLLMGYTTDLVVGVWAGNTDNSPSYLDGSVSAGPIWHQLMVLAHQPQFAQTLAGPDGKPIPPDFPVPPDVYQTAVCNRSTPEWVVRGTEKKVVCDAGAP